ncbi:MAG: ABC transporter ATP-binding protein/permease [Alphaproteobacteria bacterium]|nr:ABC transporter ATP-binding protein/permease [Alphaproteobacteria bacterium]
MLPETGFARAAWALARAYWSSDDRRTAWALLAAIVFLALFQVAISVWFNTWQGDFYNVLEKKDEKEFFRLLGLFAIGASVAIVTAVYSLYLRQMLQIRWRRWLTDRFLDQWLAARTHYRLAFVEGVADNPDQRIADDLQNFCAGTLSLSLGLLSSVVTLVSFVGILWGLSGPLAFTVAGTEISIPGYMVWVAIVYAALGSWLTYKIGLPLVGLNFEQQKREADFRFGLIRVRENGEAIALYRGEADEQRVLSQRFLALATNWYALMDYQKRLTWFTAGYAQIAIIFPFLVAAPRYFSGAIPLGSLVQTSNAFGQVQGSLSWFVDAYTQLAGWKASVDRILGYQRAMARIEREMASGAGISGAPAADGRLSVHGLTLGLPDGRTLIAGADLAVAPGERVLVAGASGSGKSTLFRAIAGIWPWGSGSVARPWHADGHPGGAPAHGRAAVLFLPQRPYLPLGTLRAAICYPARPDAFPDGAIKAALEHCRLAPLAARLDEETRWDRALSPGEQQRLGFARVLLHQPDWLFMDEATAAMDETLQGEMLALLREALPRAGIVSIGHRPGLERHHDRRIRIEPGPEGGRLVESAAA